MTRILKIAAMLSAIVAVAGLAHATPKIDCDARTLVGTDADRVIISVGDEVIELTQDAVSLNAFCDRHRGLVGYVLPVPKPVDDELPETSPFPDPTPQSPPSAGEMVGPRKATGFTLGQDRINPFPSNTPEDESEANEWFEPAPSPARASDDSLPDSGATDAAAAGCDVGSTDAPFGLAWFLAIPLWVRRRKGGAA